MSRNENLLIENFATMIESGDRLNHDQAAQRTLDFMKMLGDNPSLSMILNMIKSRLESILRDEDYMQQLANSETASADIATRLRDISLAPMGVSEMLN